jgi:hypothetical protein
MVFTDSTATVAYINRWEAPDQIAYFGIEYCCSSLKKGWEGPLRQYTFKGSCNHRHVSQKGTYSTNIMVSQPVCSSSHLCSMGKAPDVIVHDQVQFQVPGICVISTRISGIPDRCTLHGLEQSVGV